ncbi:YdcF family protein [Rossellomorea sp. DUT-2]|uniref:YdcF family protein n=1 Tax=Rossellomorea sp. DUT-2 TaxID=3412021 RepID=UPI003D173240
MKPLIPKEPIIPHLNQEEICFLTKVTFEDVVPPKECDALFIFSGTHQGHWEKAIEAFNNNYTKRIIVTGGRSLTGIPHPDWEGNQDDEVSEAKVIISYLLKAGIPSESIVYEEKSTNSLENVLYAKEVFDFTSITSLMVICKSHTAGRQIRTLKKHLPQGIAFVPYTFDTTYKETEVNRNNWMNSEVGKKRVWGEYLRIDHYGKLGHLKPLGT